MRLSADDLARLVATRECTNGVIVRVVPARRAGGKPCMYSICPYKSEGIAIAPDMEIVKQRWGRRRAQFAISGDHPTLTAALCGDPLPGRSALDLREGSA